MLERDFGYVRTKTRHIFYRTISKKCNKLTYALANHVKELREPLTWKEGYLSFLLSIVCGRKK